MKPIQVHPVSAVAGAVLTLLSLLAAGSLQVQTGPKAFALPQEIPLTIEGHVDVAGIPTPQQMVVIKEEAPFTVPDGKLLVITGLGATRNGFSVALFVDGQYEMESVANLTLGNATTIQAVPPGRAIAGGSLVTVTSGQGLLARAWGYLVDA